MTEQKFEMHGYALEGIAFGLTDGIICFLGLAIGVARATSDPTLVIIACVIGGIADAFGNSIGFLISQATERSVQIHEVKEHGKKTRIHSKREVLISGVFTFLATILVLILLISPFLFLNIAFAMILAVLSGTIMSFVLGSYVGKLSGVSPNKSGFKYACFTIAGALISYTIGELLSIYLRYGV